MKFFLPLFLIFTVLPPGAFGTALDDSGPWQKVKMKDGIDVSKREISGSPVLAFKGTGIIDAPISRVATVIFDASRGTEWIEDLLESRVLRWISADDFIEYDHIGTPFVMRDRDFISLVKLRADRAKQNMSISYTSVEEPGAPRTTFIRGNLLHTTFSLKSIENGTKTYLEGDILCDPKGSVPKWIVNFFQEDWPIDTFKSLRKQVAKPDVLTNPKFVSMLGLDKT